MECRVHHFLALLFLFCVQANPEKKKIVIFGATGQTGLCALEAAVKKGLSVRAFVREPSKIPEHLRDKVEVFIGNVLELASVTNAVDGTDAVVIALGTHHNVGPTTDLSIGTKNIIEAMKEKNVRIVSACLSSLLFEKQVDVPLRFVDVNEDHKRMFKVLKESLLDWIAVFSPQIVDEPSRDIQVVVNAVKSPGLSISKWDLGTFLVDSLDDPKYYRKVVGICNVPEQ